MKKIGFFTFLFLLSVTAFSQRKSRLSFTASPTVNWLSSDGQGVESGDITLGLDYGLDADFYFDDKNRYAFGTGVIISHTGGNLRYTDATAGHVTFAGQSFPSGTTFHYALRYIEVPLTIKLRTGEFRRWAYWGQFGFSGFVNIQAKGNSNNGTMSKTTINDEINLFNLALNLGFGSTFDLGGNNAIAVGLIYKNGFIDVTTNDQFKDKASLNSLVFKLGLLF